MTRKSGSEEEMCEAERRVKNTNMLRCPIKYCSNTSIAKHALDQRARVEKLRLQEAFQRAEIERTEKKALSLQKKVIFKETGIIVLAVLTRFFVARG